MAENKRRKYDPEFKRDTVALVEDSGRTISDITESLDIRPDLISRWRRE